MSFSLNINKHVQRPSVWWGSPNPKPYNIKQFWMKHRSFLIKIKILTTEEIINQNIQYQINKSNKKNSENALCKEIGLIFASLIFAKQHITAILTTRENALVMCMSMEGNATKNDKNVNWFQLGSISLHPSPLSRPGNYFIGILQSLLHVKPELLEDTSRLLLLCLADSRCAEIFHICY